MKKEFGIYFWLHLLVLIPAYISPLLFDWKLVILGSALLEIQYYLIGGCFLTHLQLGKDKNETFVWYYLHKIFPSMDAAKTKFIVRIIVPVVLITAAFILQVQYNFKPLIY